MIAEPRIWLRGDKPQQKHFCATQVQQDLEISKFIKLNELHKFE